ncbi:MAG: hypothetical protein IPP40_15385 [bacterium]|nr:hypothetical protein [bacterium]
MDKSKFTLVCITLLFPLTLLAQPQVEWVWTDSSPLDSNHWSGFQMDGTLSDGAVLLVHSSLLNANKLVCVNSSGNTAWERPYNADAKTICRDNQGGFVLVLQDTICFLDSAGNDVDRLVRGVDFSEQYPVTRVQRDGDGFICGSSRVNAGETTTVSVFRLEQDHTVSASTTLLYGNEWEVDGYFHAIDARSSERVLTLIQEQSQSFCLRSLSFRESINSYSIQLGICHESMHYAFQTEKMDAATGLNGEIFVGAAGRDYGAEDTIGVVVLRFDSADVPTWEHWYPLPEVTT